MSDKRSDEEALETLFVLEEEDMKRKRKYKV
jgi:hypothetical protein